MAAISGIDGASLKTCLCRVIEEVNSDPTAAAVLKAQGVWDDLKVLRRRWKSPRANTYSKTTAVIMCSNMSPEVKRCWKAYMNRILKFSNTAEHVVRAYTVAEFLVTDLFDDVWSSITNPMEKIKCLSSLMTTFTSGRWTLGRRFTIQRHTFWENRWL